jgi:heme/copper-type cytochrome/quinol oxidase subunit 1
MQDRELPAEGEAFEDERGKSALAIASGCARIGPLLAQPEAPSRMLTLARYFIKTSLLFLALGLMIGAHMSATFFLRHEPPDHFLVVAHTHLLLVGFVVMMIMGVALWMFPKPAKDDRRYRPGIAWAGYVAMTVATATRALGEIALGFGGTASEAREIFLGLSTVGGLLQATGGLLFAYNIWTRIRSVTAAMPPRAAKAP